MSTTCSQHILRHLFIYKYSLVGLLGPNTNIESPTTFGNITRSTYETQDYIPILLNPDLVPTASKSVGSNTLKRVALGSISEKDTEEICHKTIAKATSEERKMKFDS